MTNQQLYILLAPSIMALFGVFFGAFTTNKRIDAMRDDMKSMRTTLEAIQHDLARISGTQRAHDEAIATLKERAK